MRSGVKVCHTHTHTRAHTALSHTKAQAASPLSYAAGKQQMAGQAFQLEYGVQQQQQPVRALTFRGQKSNMKTDCAASRSLLLLLALPLPPYLAAFSPCQFRDSRCADFCLSAGRHLNFSFRSVSSTPSKRRWRRRSSGHGETSW